MEKLLDTSKFGTTRQERLVGKAGGDKRATPAGNDSHTDRVVWQLTTRILDGDLKRGDSLPPERELALQLGVSRPVVREATKTLHAEGLVSIRHGVGTIVNGANSKPVQKGFRQALYGKEDALDKLYEVRSVLEPEIVSLAAQRATPANIERLHQICLSLDTTLGTDPAQKARFVELDMKFHGALAEATMNDAFVMVLEAATTLLVNEYSRSPRLGIANLVAQRMHWAIFEAVKHRDGTLAAELMREHLKAPASVRHGNLKGGRA